jgi:hypothetical protein
MQAAPVLAAAENWTSTNPRLSSGDSQERPAAAPRAWRWADVGSLALLLLIASSVRLYLVRNTEVAARDSIGFIRYAWQLGHQPWTEVLRATEQPPLYALAIRAAATPVRHFMDAPESIVMQRSAQLVSAIAGILLVLPLYFLGRELFDRGIAFWAIVLFQFLPATGRFLSDGLSEATFLLFVASALWLGVRSLRTRSSIGFALAGLCGGLAYLTRIEGGLVVASFGLVLVGCQAIRVQRWPLRHFLVCAAALAIAALVVAGPYMAVIGGITNKESIRRTIQDQTMETQRSATAGLPIAVWWQGEKDASKGWWGLWALGTELSRGAFHIGWPAALLGLWLCRARIRGTPGLWVLVLLCTIMALALWRLANVMGYLSDRHCLVILLCSMYWTAAGFKVAGDWLARRVQPYFGEWTAQKGLWRQVIEERLTSGRAVAAILFLAVVAAAMPKTLETLHGNRAGMRQAGLWLSEHADFSDEIVDPYCWAHYYAGCVFREGMPTNPAPGHVPVRYVVLEHSKSEHSRLAGIEEARSLEQQGREVFRWNGKQGKNAAELVVYEVAAAR